MKKQVLITCALLSLFVVSAFAQNPRSIVFYNVENFFDTIRNPEIYDEDFTPEGSYNWTGAKYKKKLSNIEKVLFDIAKRAQDFPTIICLSEIENRSVIEDIASTPKLAAANYDIVHFDSPDARGVDVGFMYRPDVFKIEGSKAIKSVIADTITFPDYRTRDIVTMWGQIEGQPFFFMGAHWSSPYGGELRTIALRQANALQMRQIADSVRRVNPDTRFVMMGDFNDNPVDNSILNVLGAKGSLKDMQEGDFFNPYYAMYKAGYGSLAYNGEWNIYDNIVVSGNLLDGDNQTLQLQPSPTNKKFYGNIFKEYYLIQQSGSFRGVPFRTFSNTAFTGGYSDHLPVFIYID